MCTGHALVSALVNRDFVRQHKSVADMPMSQRPALILTEETGARRLLLHYERNILQAPSEAARDLLERTLYQGIEFARTHAHPLQA
jgi:hypothetical protein